MDNWMCKVCGKNPDLYRMINGINDNVCRCVEKVWEKEGMRVSVVRHLHYELAIRALGLMREHEEMRIEDFRELQEVQKIWSAMDVLEQYM